jgi:choline monooxygenase
MLRFRGVWSGEMCEGRKDYPARVVNMLHTQDARETMSDFLFEVHEDIRQAHTLPARVYTDPAIYEAAKERVFARSWQFVTDAESVRVPGQVHPFTLLEGCLDEPLLFTRDGEDAIHCLSNVCTHRGNIVIEHGGHERALRCRYHGRRFGLDGTFQQMPEFEAVVGFPTPCDNLPGIPFGAWRSLLFASLAPSVPLETLLAPMEERVGWLPLDQFRFDATRSREYLVRANWALYVENYLDGLHIPFVHYELAGALDYGEYVTENHRYGNLQLGVAQSGEDRFDLPAASPDYGKNIAAYYFWLFPNTMFNFYPWGLSVNVVRPVGVNLTRVAFLRYAWDDTKLGSGYIGDDAAVDRVEREDEAVVETVQKGVRSRFYDKGRYSPTRETGTHHFHRLLAESLNSG